ncbi:uncharacterized protein LOC130748094 isoform X2 [Lotus japonicus]|uniref:uncharacterized protein LOC130748094 isoform X2 n=1 Tax=Lotus japonicus TaxID=34305 RepID=UPI002584720D|nr:uncharacterized protein LOC130748094 isoform X2 [Lotus japonicus]XP_057457202.1 uncharacterized protein LOC130748094 isoform X2 [Lotus japonicus]XP_057457203.1 uncharacterized protein LOC130748094 isoform X2 [Lotus japonicus]XP_057457204.1 uncharacterized protein LOC130748094 isoform X2 [Lotus japonicus]XP_057457205.1 uncharacterized protein LOC130748094 isoform X2 [Lotus japonicus]XP_057457206.1 uncharacterized protein LOC130748094 isoform X2 [Lotus japonicus]XP_057457207.1 uncharacterize
MLKGDAEYWWRSTRLLMTTNQVAITWDSFKTAFLNKYFLETARDDMENRFLRLKQGSMTVGEYAAKLESLSKYFRFFREQVDEGYLCNRFMIGLRDEIEESVRPLGVRVFQQLVEKSREVEVMKNRRGNRQESGGPIRSGQKQAGKTEKGRAGQKKPYQNATGRTSSTKVGAKTPREDVTCFKCNEKGHYANECGKEITCWKCQKTRHISTNCPDAPKAEPVLNTARGRRPVAKGRVFAVTGKQAEGVEDLIQGSRTERLDRTYSISRGKRSQGDFEEFPEEQCFDCEEELENHPGESSVDVSISMSLKEFGRVKRLLPTFTMMLWRWNMQTLFNQLLPMKNFCGLLTSLLHYPWGINFCAAIIWRHNEVGEMLVLFFNCIPGSGHGIQFVRNDAKIFRFYRSKCHKNFKMKRNPRKVKWTKAYRRVHGKEMTRIQTFEFERKRNRPERYDRNVKEDVLKAIPKIAKIKASREETHHKKMKQGKNEKQRREAEKELKQGINMVNWSKLLLFFNRILHTLYQSRSRFPNRNQWRISLWKNDSINAALILIRELIRNIREIACGRGLNSLRCFSVTFITKIAVHSAPLRCLLRRSQTDGRKLDPIATPFFTDSMMNMMMS